MVGLSTRPRAWLILASFLGVYNVLRSWVVPDALRREFLERFGVDAEGGDTSSTLCHERLLSALRSPDEQ